MALNQGISRTKITVTSPEKGQIKTDLKDAVFTFTGALAKYGNVIVEFPCTSSLTYNFGWPSEAE